MRTIGQDQPFADPSLDHLVRAQQQRLRDRDAERLGGFQVDDQLELCRLQDRQIGNLGDRRMQPVRWSHSDARDVAGAQRV